MVYGLTRPYLSNLSKRTCLQIFFQYVEKKISALLISNLLSKYFLERSFLSHFSYRWEPGDLKYVVPI